MFRTLVPSPHRPRPRRARGATGALLSACLVLSGLVGLSGPAIAVTDTDPEFHLNRADLEFILKQITISESHAAGGDLLCESRTDLSGTCVPDPKLPWGLRTVDGSLNNLMPGGEHFGASSQVFPRLVAPTFRDAELTPPFAPGNPNPDPGPATSYAQTSGFVYDSQPRIISNLVSDQTTNNPAAVAAAESVPGSVINSPTPNDDGALEFARIEESAPQLTFTEGWIGAQTPDRRSGPDGAYLYTDTSDNAFTVTFTGSAVRWIAAFGPARGIASVSLDGAAPVEVDLYAAAWAYQAVAFEALDLGAGPHTLTVTNTGTMNPAATLPRVEVDAIDIGTLVGWTSEPGEIFIPNRAPDAGLSAPFNSWLTLFGQFFDHGLDLVSKGGNGTVVVPLQPDDSLYDPDSQTNFIAVTRATQVLDENGVVQHVNRTTPFVDQNQTYTSHPSHQAFLREYVATADGPVPTGRLLNGPDADQDGIGDGLARWADIKAQSLALLGIELDDLDVNEIPLLATDLYGRFLPGQNGYPQLVVLLDPNAPDVPENRGLVEGDPAAPVDASQALKAGHAFLDDIAHAAVPTAVGYDAALLDAHFISGDGRGNENIGLTAVHHVFHAEHNRLVGHIEDVLEATGDAAFIAKWHAQTGPWDYGERLFQAARFVTEMEYQHLAFEEYARFVVPTIDNQPINETAYHHDIDPAILAEFAHVVYRFGHSMLTDTIDRAGFGTESLPLLDAFLAPTVFTDDGRITPDQGAAAIIQGMAGQTGNGIDEFVIPTLRDNLLGLPLDLVTINMARARETGSPSLQEVRTSLYEATADGALEPYDSWADFRLALRYPASIVNFVAAYGDHPSIRGAVTVAEKREAAQTLVTDTAFMTLPSAESGLDDVDFWAGGLAEAGLVFGGLLGTTFNFVFEQQMESLQNADRFYYLTRTQGLNLIHQLENNSFSELVMRTTDAALLPANLFSSPDRSIDLGNLPDPLPEGFTFLGGTWRYDGEEHVVIHGTDAGEGIRGGLGDDSIWGHGGNDRLEGGQGNDTVHGGTGDDIITDLFGDDTLHGGPGNDAINGGSGIDLIFGNTGSDFILHGNEITTSFAGAGTDFVRGGNANDLIAGNEDDDWLEGGNGHDLVQGDNALTFQNDPVGGADILFGGSGNDDHDAEGGDDIMLNNGIDRHAGMLGFDWVTHKHDPFAADSDLDVSIFQPPNVTLMRSRFFNVEGLSGWNGNDVLRGRSDPGDQFLQSASGHELTQAHLDRIIGLRDLLGGGAVPVYAAPFMITDRANDILLGGAGSDIIEGRSGDDFIDGDAALDVYLLGPGGERQESMQPFQARIFAGQLSPADLTIVREIVYASDQEGVIDTAVYADVRANHTITDNGDGTWRVAHVEEDPTALTSGVDILRNIERLVFADEVIDLVVLENGAAFGSIVLSTMNPVENQPITATSAFDDPQGIQEDTIVWTWQWQDDEGEWETSVSGSGLTFVPGDVEAGWPLRVIATFTDNAGTLETITSPATLPVVNVNDPPTGLAVSVASPVVGDVVQAVGLRDADGLTNDDGEPTVTYAYEWQQGDGTTFTAIGGATAASLTVTDALLGRQLRVVVSYTDNHGTAEVAVSPPTAAVTAAPVPGFALSTSAVEFGPTAPGVTSATQDVTVTNTGTAVLSVSDVVLGGVNPGAFATSTTCLAVVPGGTCTITVSFTPTAAGSFTADLVVTHDAAGGPATVTLSGEGVVPVVPGPAFSDVPATHPFHTEISWLAGEGVVAGFSDGTYRSGAAVSRQAMAAFLYRFAGVTDFTAPATSPFSDVPTDHPFYTEITWLAQEGITTGYGDGTFRGGSSVTREAMAAFLYRFAGITGYTAPIAPQFSDVPTSHSFYTEVSWLAQQGITTGYGDGTFHGGDLVTRGAMAAFLYRYAHLGG